MPQLIITGDDCGLSEGINNATIELYQRGMLTTASIMTNCRAAQHAYEVFAPYTALRTGVHLNLTDGVRKFGQRWTVFARSLAGRREFLHDVERELTVQVENYIQGTGRTPQHLTTHMQFHVVPSLRDIVLQLAETYHVPWIRDHRFRDTVVPGNFLLRRDPTPYQPRGIHTLDFIMPLASWLLNPPSQTIGELMSLNGTVELVIHPSRAIDPNFPNNVGYPPARRYLETSYLQQIWPQLLEAGGDDLTIGEPAA